MTFHYGSQFFSFLLRGSGMGEKHDVDASQFTLAHPERLSNDTLDPVADHGAARALA